ncbi:MAG: Gfo/Idh/MocA family oxidoreductase [Spirochaetales bacterium]|nr:Gfo/Idh/MocA family oxidoreductase [Spirochaetales bacterium]
MDKIRFAVIGSGWRSLFYLRIARALPDIFEVVCVKVRNEEKKRFIQDNYGFDVVMSDEEVFALRPDFCVIAVFKSELSEVSRFYLEHGMAVLCETPLALDRGKLESFGKFLSEGEYAFMTAEQYYLYPRYSALIKVLDSGIIGRRNFLRMGICHEYHGFSLARRILGSEGYFRPVFAKRQEYEIRQTYSRYEHFTDLSMKKNHREVVYYETDDGRVMLEDFTPECYRSPIRPVSFNVEGEKGSCRDFVFYFLDDENETHTLPLEVESRIVHREDVNPVQQDIEVIDRIRFNGSTVFSSRFPGAVLSEDEYAIASVMLDMKNCVDGKKASYPFSLSYLDADNTLLLYKALGI